MHLYCVDHHIASSLRSLRIIIWCTRPYCLLAQPSPLEEHAMTSEEGAEVDLCKISLGYVNPGVHWTERLTNCVDRTVYARP